MGDSRRKLAAAVFMAVAFVLVLSPGGAGIVAAPVLLPVSWYLARRSQGLWRAGLLVVAGAVVALVAWAALYVFADQRGAGLVVLPLGAAILTIAFAYERLTVPGASSG